MKCLDLFSGIGGFALGLERAGMETIAFCEIDPFCRKVLAKHWPDVPIYGDIRELTGEQLRSDGIVPDLICGGFPCQDISVAGRGPGLDGERSGLWSEYARLIGEVRPAYVVVENVSALLSRGLGVVLGDLAALGFDAEWHCIPAAAVGAPHRRDRVWIVAYAKVNGRLPRGKGHAAEESRGRKSDRGCIEPHVADASELRCAGPWPLGDASYPAPPKIGQAIELGDGRIRNQWRVEPDVGRVAHGVRARVDRLRALGNAVVPQVVEVIGRAIMEAA